VHVRVDVGLTGRRWSRALGLPAISFSAQLSFGALLSIKGSSEQDILQQAFSLYRL